MRNYCFGYSEELLETNEFTRTGEINYLYITDILAFEFFATKHGMETLGIVETNTFYQWDNENDVWTKVESADIIDRLKKSIY